MLLPNKAIQHLLSSLPFFKPMISPYPYLFILYYSCYVLIIWLYIHDNDFSLRHLVSCRYWSCSLGMQITCKNDTAEWILLANKYVFHSIFVIQSSVGIAENIFLIKINNFKSHFKQWIEYLKRPNNKAVFYEPVRTFYTDLACNLLAQLK